MSKSIFHKHALALGKAIISIVTLSGCADRMAPESFVRTYEKLGVQTFTQGEYKFSLLYQSQEYQLAKEMLLGSLISDGQSQNKLYGKEICVSITVIPREITGTPEDIRIDLLNGKLAGGHNQFRKQLFLLQHGLKQFVFLEDIKGNEISPLTYSFTRNFGLGIANTLLFVFPSEYAGQKIDLKNVKIAIHDFGLNTGTIRRELIIPESVKLRI